MKKISAIFLILFLIACTNPYKPNYSLSDPNAFPQNNLSIVSVRFKIAGSLEKVETLWRRVENNGASERMEIFPAVKNRGRVEAMIEPGTYFLDGIRFKSDGVKVSKGAFFTLYPNEQKGWDFLGKKPLWFSFTVGPKEKLLIPDIIVFGSCKNGKKSCAENEMLFILTVQDEEETEPKKYLVGDAVTKK